MNFERQKRLVERLSERTRAGDLSWREGIGTDTFQVSFPNSSVQIRKLVGKEPLYMMSVIDDHGNVVDLFNDENLISDREDLKKPWRSMMEELFISARRKALRADEVIDGILSEIG